MNNLQLLGFIVIALLLGAAGFLVTAGNVLLAVIVIIFALALTALEVLSFLAPTNSRDIRR